MAGNNLTARGSLDSSTTGISRKSPRSLGSLLALPAVALFAVLAMVLISGGAAASISSGARATISSDTGGFSGPSGGGIVPVSWNNGRFLGLGSVASSATGPGICGASAVPLSSCHKKDDDVEIGANGCGPDVYVDKDFVKEHKFRTITIEPGATLCFPDRSVKFEVSNVAVLGTLQIGQQSHPIGMNDPANHVTLEFFGRKDSEGVKNPGCVDPVSDKPFKKGIEVCKGGSLQMYGINGVPTYGGVNWTYLSAPAGPSSKYGKGTGVAEPVERDGSETLYVAKNVATGQGAWQTGDWIAVGGTGFSPFDTEIVKIAKIVQNPTAPTGAGATGAEIYLSTPLTHYHFGGEAPTPGDVCMKTDGSLSANACTSNADCTASGENGQCIAASYADPKEQNYGVDERAPVALVSRSIELTAIIPQDQPASRHWGGELKFLPEFKEVSVQGVELQKFGKDHLGSYPIHFHMDGDVANKPLVDSNTIDHSYNHCITVHATQNLTISNNVCVRTVGSMFYEEIGTESGITFDHNLGMGAMSYSFNINGTQQKHEELIKKYWWTGDYMTNRPGDADYIHYNGFDVPDMDNKTNPIHGSCAKLGPQGQLIGYAQPYGSCPPPKDHDPDGIYKDYKIYIEPANGFWITNQGTNLIDNVIDGCQGVGAGYWYLAPAPNNNYPAVNFNQYLPVGTFQNNRVTGCYDGLFGENEYSMQSAQLMHPTTDGTPGGLNTIATFDGLTATRNRDRGVWLRDQWFVLNNGRFATNRDSATLLTAGGVDGATPGDWMLVENSVLEGISQNNVDRFGPCPINDTSFQDQAPRQGCIAQTPKKDGELHGGDEIGKGYPDPNWNLAGYMIYDGPARLDHDRFVNFNADPKPQMTNDDVEALNKWAAAHNLTKKDGTKVPWVYEGDAALGWFQSNQSSYPTLTNSMELSFVNSDLRHQIYTELVNLGAQSEGFQDGDKNTAILDLDGTLSGYEALDASNNGPTNFEGPHPISLNNLMFNASGNSVDECDSEGAQDKVLENRPTSLMTASSMATLEFQAPYPKASATQANAYPLQKQAVTFTSDSVDFSTHFTMTLHSRNALGVWEPKVTSGLGYTITAGKAADGTSGGIPNVVDVGVIDAVKPTISTSNPFYVRVGICYTNAQGGHPQSPSDFTITSGYHSYGGGVIGGGPDNPKLRPYYNKLFGLYTDGSGNEQTCDNLDGVTLVSGYPKNLLPNTGCPADGITPVPTSGSCPAGTTQGTDNRAQKVCVYPKNTLSSVSSFSALSNSDGTPTTNGLNDYYYDKNTGWLFFYVAQDQPNALGPSPLGSCTTRSGGPCPNIANDETYYVCPAQGCTDYVVRLNDSSYKPGQSACPDPYDAAVNNGTDATITNPPQPYHLAYASGPSQGQSVVRNPAGGSTDFPHYEPQTKPVCP